MPAMIRAPGRVSSGITIDEPAIVMDVLPTVLNLAGIDVPDNLDGVDLTGALRSESELDPERPLFFYRSGQLRSMRKGKWKMHVPHRYVSMTEETGAVPGSGGHPGSYGRAEIGVALYDLFADPAESVDLKDEYPEVVAELMTHIEFARAHIGDELTDRVGSEATPPQFIEKVWPTLEDDQ